MMAGTSHTKTGLLIGTAAYLAPEQVSRGTADARTDVYAAGIMLFEMLTGTQPHTADTPLAVAYKHVNEVVPAPSRFAPGITPSLDALVTRATSRDPDLRPVDAGQFLRAASEVRRSLPPAPAAPRPPAPGTRTRLPGPGYQARRTVPGDPVPGATPMPGRATGPGSTSRRASQPATSRTGRRSPRRRYVDDLIPGLRPGGSRRRDGGPLPPPRPE